MSYLSSTVVNSQLWKNTLAQVADDEFQTERERLRASFCGFRERASQLSVEIRADLPDLTVHDITHLDALWEIASLIVGKNYPLTPTEGYVLGGAILLHDLATSVAATPGGYDAIRSDQRWIDLVYTSYQEAHQRNPTEAELREPEVDIRRYVLFTLLRQKHAENAEKLAFLSFGENRQYLIEDTELRQTFGRIIGQIAHSHWRPISQIEKSFDKVIGAPHWAPPNWTINPVKLACILRASDAAHIDARRAPTFVKAFSTLGNSSIPHWEFQEKLNKPYIQDDVLVFTSGQAFPLDEASNWWLCLETLRMIDRELRGIDSLLSDKSLPRFAARRVAGADLPERLAAYVQTLDWLPINATIHISDLPHIIKSIGGEELYGNSPRIPVRELIQNASDAIRARRYYEKRASDFGEIRVALRQESGNHFLRVEDTGVGMSQRVLTDFLLDFGSSFWTKPQVQEEFPGLLSSGFKATGKYGIGFFSVFMIADRITVITRRPDAAAKDTLVLTFGAGLSGRPILRPAETHEQLLDGGTVIQLQLKIDPRSKGGILYTYGEMPELTLKDLCQQIAPALDTRVSVTEEGGDSEIAMEANDWQHIPGVTMLARLNRSRAKGTFTSDQYNSIFELASRNLRLIRDDSGAIVGRACIAAGFHSDRVHTPDVAGAVVVGGLATSTMHGIWGIILGSAIRASRDYAKPSVSKDNLAKWATEQADLVPNLFPAEADQVSCALNIRICGGNTKGLLIAIHAGKWVSAQDIETMDLPDKIIIMDMSALQTELKHADGLELGPNVFLTRAHGIPVIFQEGQRDSIWGGSFLSGKHSTPLTLAGAIVEAATVAWKVDIQEVVKINEFDREKNIRIGVGKSGVIKADVMVIARPHGTTT